MTPKPFHFLLLLISSFTWAQAVKGKVVDEKNLPLAGANIYLDGTSIATIANNQGDFYLPYGSKTNGILAISYIGYQTMYIQDFDGKDLKIVLKEAVNALENVVLKKDRFTRKQKLKLFREQFLGQTAAGKKAIIENEDELYFDYDEKNMKFKAYANNPLIIKNVYLGYKVTYELVDFEVTFNQISIQSADVRKSFHSGLSRFEEMEVNPKILKRRKKSYEGSALQFFRNLANNVWNNDNFRLFVGSFPENPDNYFKVSGDTDLKKVEVTKTVDFKDNSKFLASFNLLYKKNKQSKIIFNTNTFYIDQFGNNTNIEDITFSGEIGTLKVADMLPLNITFKE